MAGCCGPRIRDRGGPRACRPRDRLPLRSETAGPTGGEDRRRRLWITPWAPVFLLLGPTGPGPANSHTWSTSRISGPPSGCSPHGHGEELRARAHGQDRRDCPGTRDAVRTGRVSAGHTVAHFAPSGPRPVPCTVCARNPHLTGYGFKAQKGAATGPGSLLGNGLTGRSTDWARPTHFEMGTSGPVQTGRHDGGGLSSPRMGVQPRIHTGAGDPLGWRVLTVLRGGWATSGLGRCPAPPPAWSRAPPGPGPSRPCSLGYQFSSVFLAIFSTVGKDWTQDLV